MCHIVAEFLIFLYFSIPSSTVGLLAHHPAAGSEKRGALAGEFRKGCMAPFLSVLSLHNLQ